VSAEQMSLLSPAYSGVDFPPYGWEHLPIKATQPWKLPVTGDWSGARVQWPAHLAHVVEVLRDDRLPPHEVGYRPGFAASDH
jgi:hypothetical protein